MNKLSLGVSTWLLIGGLTMLFGPIVLAVIIGIALLAIPVLIFAFIVKVFVLVFRA